MKDILIKDATIINRGEKVHGDLLIRNGRIAKIGGVLQDSGAREINGAGKWVIPGLIDDQVHFREPGLTHKATIHSESRAAVAGGVTSFMEMPNTKPPAITQALLEEKYQIAAQSSLANYSFYMGASNDNLEEVLKTDASQVCGVKIFMGSSTGNMLVDDERTLEGLFSRCPMLMATHCEDEQTIRSNLEEAKELYGEDIPIQMHPIIRNRKACLLSSRLAVSLAEAYNARLHILHISTKEEPALFSQTPLDRKTITSEACVHHLSFSYPQYAILGNQIKCNPAIKAESDRKAIWEAVLNDHIDVIATDHAPHTWDEKSKKYLNAPSGLPLVQHSLNLLLNHMHEGTISIERIVEKACHAPAILFKVSERGFLDEGYYADMVILDPEAQWTVDKSQLLYKCGWSPLEGRSMKGKIETTIVNGRIAYDQGKIIEVGSGARLVFNNAS